MSDKNVALVVEDSYTHIRGYAEEYVRTLITYFGSGIAKEEALDESVVIYFDVAAITELIRRGGNNTNFLAAVLGIHQAEGTPELTISLLCADANLEILKAHVEGSLPGQEVWPFHGKVSEFSKILPLSTI